MTMGEATEGEAGELKRELLFVQTEHKKTLSLLFDEIERLKTGTQALQFQHTMGTNRQGVGTSQHCHAAPAPALPHAPLGIQAEPVHTVATDAARVETTTPAEKEPADTTAGEGPSQPQCPEDHTQDQQSPTANRRVDSRDGGVAADAMVRQLVAENRQKDEELERLRDRLEALLGHKNHPATTPARLPSLDAGRRGGKEGSAGAGVVKPLRVVVNGAGRRRAGQSSGYPALPLVVVNNKAVESCAPRDASQNAQVILPRLKLTGGVPSTVQRQKKTALMRLRKRGVIR